MLSYILVLTLLAVKARAAFYTSSKDLPAINFDFIIVGGGTAGNVVANRLTEIPDVSVLVLEAGGSDKGILELQVPFYCSRLQTSPYNWNYTTAPMPGLNGRSVPYPRGFVIGGSSSINYMGYIRGTSEDYDRYATVTKDDGWSWEDLQSYIRKNERFIQPVDYRNTEGEYNPAAHGYHGINTVSLPGFVHPIDGMVLQTLQQLPQEFPYNEDTNSGYHLGFGWVQSTITNGTRSSSSTSYLGPKYISRPNLHVLLNTRVARVLPTPSASTQVAFRGVEFTQDAGASFQTLRANREVILSAGVIGTPSILLHSGIGDSSDLLSVGITPIHHLPSVGRNLTEHPVIANHWLVGSTLTFETINRNTSLATELLREWNETKMGPLNSGLMGWLGWFRLPSDSPIWQNFTDPAAGPNTGHFEYIVSNGLTRQLTPPTDNNYLGFSAVMVTPLSRGSVTINSTNPLDPPIINPNLLSSDLDLFVLREAFRKTNNFTSAPAWDGYLISPATDMRNATDEELDEFIRNNANPIYHPVGTPATSSTDASYGAVNPDLRVKGVDGLRIVDAAVLPFVPAAHTQAVTYIVAERAADLIKERYRVLN